MPTKAFLDSNVFIFGFERSRSNSRRILDLLVGGDLHGGVTDPLVHRAPCRPIRISRKSPNTGPRGNTYKSSRNHRARGTNDEPARTAGRGRANPCGRAPAGVRTRAG